MITKVDASKSVMALVKDFGQMQMRQVPWAFKWAANATMRDTVDPVRMRMRQLFNTSPRGRRWMENHVRALRDGSYVAREYGGSGSAAVAVIPPGGAKAAGWERYRGSLLPMFERGGPTPGPKRFGGSGQSGMSDLGRYPIPIRRPGQPQPYPLKLYPVNLGLSSRTGISGRRAVGGGLRGKHRTYLVPMLNNRGTSMVFQRFGQQRDDTMPIFWVQRDTQVPRRPYFFETAQRSVTTRFAVHFPAALEHALFGRGAYAG